MWFVLLLIIVSAALVVYMFMPKKSVERNVSAQDQENFNNPKISGEKGGTSRTKSFSRNEAISFGWNMMKANLRFFIGILIVAGIVQVTTEVVGKFAAQRIVIKQDFLSVTYDVDGLFDNLIEQNYINRNGVIQEKIRLFRNHSSMKLDFAYENQKEAIFQIMKRALNKIPPSKIAPHLISYLFWALSLVIGLGLIKIVLKLCDNKETKFADLFSCFPLFFKYLFSSILFGLIVVVGALLLIIPGIILGIRLQFFGYLIVDKNLGPIAALKESARITKGTVWDLFVFGAVLIFITLAGFLCLGVGLFAAIPTTMVAIAFVYRKLLEKSELIQESSI